jgi:ParB-like chromosome segregation protein Spo0J
MTATKHERHPVNNVHVPERFRSRVNEERVSAIAESMKQIGLMTPITVYVGEYGPKKITGPILVAGHHRLLAARKLGHYDVSCIVTSASPTDRRLWEISENLHRSELNVQERAAHIAEWVRLTAKGGQLAHPGGAQPHSKGISAAARDLGVDRAEVRRAVKIDSMTPEAKDAAIDADLADNQSALLRIAAVPAEQQVEEVQRISNQRGLSNMRREPTPEEKAHHEIVATIASYIVERVQNRPKHLKEITLDHVCAGLQRACELFANQDVELG